MKAIISVGISASGKTTDAMKWAVVDPMRRWIISRDDIRRQITAEDGKEWKWSNWNWKKEGEVTKRVDARIEEAASAGVDIYLADTNLKAKYRNPIINKLKSLGYEVEIREFPVSIEEAWKRDAARLNGVGHSVIATQHEDWLVHSERRRYVPDTSKPKCILVDVDGTLAHMNGKRGAFEWDKVHLDDVDPHVRSLVNSWFRVENMYQDTSEVIVLSGRDSCCEYMTCEWLKKNEIYYTSIFMRKAGDMRKDTVVKEEIFWNVIADNYNVQFVIDDRPSVCRMWRELGLKVFQVGNPHIEF